MFHLVQSNSLEKQRARPTMSSFPKLCYNFSNKTYAGALNFLKGLNPSLARSQNRTKGIVKPGESSLKNTKDLYTLIGRPLDEIPTVHVAGTNGKGTTCFKLAKGLTYSGLRTGLCMGPHISCFRERMQVDNEIVSEEEVVSLLDKVVELCSKNEIPATYFEIAFIMTCLHFQSKKCDVVIIEVGMGGRYDASNVISSYLSVVSSIGMDHMNSLGGTLESIASHKAGIFKPNRAALIGPGCPLDVMQGEAELKGTVMYQLYPYLADCISNGSLPRDDHLLLRVPHDTCVGQKRSCPSSQSSNDAFLDPDLLCSQLALGSLSLLRRYPLPNARQIFANLCLDVGLLNILNDSKPPCRFESVFVQKTLSSEIAGIKRVVVKVILDVAHNMPSLSALMSKIHARHGSQVRLVMGLSRGKGTAECLNIVKKFVPAERVDFIQSDNHRAISTMELYEELGYSNKCIDQGKNRMDATKATLQSVLSSIVKKSLSSNGQSCDEAALAVKESNEVTEHDILAQPDTLVCDEVLVICGSLYAMPMVRRILGINEPNDALDIGELI